VADPTWATKKISWPNPGQHHYSLLRSRQFLVAKNPEAVLDKSLIDINLNQDKLGIFKHILDWLEDSNCL